MSGIDLSDGEMLVLNGADVRRALPMAAAVEAMRDAFRALAEGRAIVPLRATLETPAGATGLAMPAYVSDPKGDALTVKVVSVVPDNPARGLPLIHAGVVVADAETGRIRAFLEGSAVTAIRTGAASGLATDLLARTDARVAAILGSGVQARTQLEAVCCVRPIERATVYSPNRDHAARFADELAGEPGFPSEIVVAESSSRAVRDADVVCAATTSSTPVFDDADLSAGVHVNAVGSFQPHVVEIPEATVLRARVVVDDRDAALDETGDLIQPVERGTLDPERLVELGAVLLKHAPGRTSDDEVTLFKSVGLGVQDATAARAIVRAAEREGLGQRVAW